MLRPDEPLQDEPLEVTLQYHDLSVFRIQHQWFVGLAIKSKVYKDVDLFDSVLHQHWYSMVALPDKKILADVNIRLLAVGTSLEETVRSAVETLNG